jgi:hypothetical protein
MALSPQERIDLGLDDPRPIVASEFAPGVSAPPDRAPNLRLAFKAGDKATAPKIRLLVNEILAGNMANADWALKQLYASNPKAALELHVKLMEFSVPVLKAVAVAVDDRSETPRAMSFMQLQQLLTSDS